jgi:hypothetical protein
MHSIVRSVHCNTIEEFFSLSVGLGQRQNDSPAMFCTILGDLKLVLQNSVVCGLNIFEIFIVILLFAKDMVVIGNSQCKIIYSKD